MRSSICEKDVWADGLDGLRDLANYDEVLLNQLEFDTLCGVQEIPIDILTARDGSLDLAFLALGQN